jgi:hypothetical protein
MSTVTLLSSLLGAVATEVAAIITSRTLSS